MNNTNKIIDILIVDDRYENLVSLEALLEASDLNIVKATSGNEALGLMLEYQFAVVLLDVQMPDMDGFEVAELMRSSERTKFIPIIFITAINKEDEYIFKGYEIGAVDYLFKPLNPVILNSKINMFLELYRNKRKLEKSREKIETQNRQLKESSIRDGLTNLYNHKHLHDILNRELALARRNRAPLSCFMIDLDYFKDVNDTYGHAFGDYVLAGFADVLRGLTRQTDILARYGGEEFVVVLPHTDLEGARVLAEKFRQKAESFEYTSDGHTKHVTISIGIATFPLHQPENAAELAEFADRALYRAKAGGRNQYRVYKEDSLPGVYQADAASGDSTILRGQLPRLLDKTRDALIASLEEVGEVQFKKALDNQRRIELLEIMGEHLGLPRLLLRTFQRAARLHDLVQIFQGDTTLEKDGPLDKHEQEKIRDYPLIMEELTHLFDIFANERMILRHHHENYDGSGYPEGLKGPEVPIGARLFAIVDAFIAMTSPRKYRVSLKPEQVIDELVKGAGKQFDPILVNHMLDTIIKKNLLTVPDDLIKNAKKEIK